MSIISNLGDLIDLSKGGDVPAFITPEDENHQSEITFRQLTCRADAVGRGLLSQGIVSGQRVAIIGRNSIDFIVSLLGILRCGAVAVPVNYKFPVETIDKILTDSDAKILLGDRDQLERTAYPLPRIYFNDQTEQGIEQFLEPGELPVWQPEADSLALLLYTSGSTGMPKGVRLTHASHLWVLETRLQNRELEGERILIAAPLYHMNALALSLLTLASHVTTVLLPQFTAPDYIRAIDRYQCSWLTAVPPMVAMMLQHPELLANSNLSSVRAIRMGSAPVNQSLYQQIRQLLPGAKIINAYGTTEGGPVVFGPHPQGLAAPLESPGYPHAAVSVRLRDEAGNIDSDRGMLELKSPGLMQGYHQRPDLKSPFTDDGYYVTGDIFSRDNQGFYVFVGRRDDMFVSGAENIYPSEVEQLLERHPAVQQACVVAVADKIKGTKPVAWVKLHKGCELSEHQLKAFSLEHGPAYLHPRHIWFVETFMLASTNKIDRNALALEAAKRIVKVSV
ncbi:class I adenylate-forming enzyme family protein [Tatumella sp. UBA2305]|uniref:class I adenylate-forming enzyme family protein n=1 Tax=Tatumella sp. UBA2305 TaxID=1947647 RepID=UPI0025E1C85B|nr:class I adenylate-forming enzyme family protein [Tatumella sp. UBA2305]